MAKRKRKGQPQQVVVGANNGKGVLLRAHRQVRGLRPAEAGLEAQKVFEWCVTELPESVFDVLGYMFAARVKKLEEEER